MTAEPDPPLPMTLIAGYLGSGKTTLVNAILSGDHGLRITVIVNDFGEIALDESLIRNRQGDTIALANGCACCAMSGDLWDAVNRVLATKPRPDRLVIETSGVADPEKIHRIALSDPDLVDAGIVTVADAVNLETLLGDPQLAEMVGQQLRAASLVIITKSDLVDDGAKASTVARIADIAPGRTLALSVPGKEPVGLALTVPPAGDTTFAPLKAGSMRIRPVDHGAVYASWAWSGLESVDSGRLNAFLGSDDCGIWRIKGILRGHGGEWMTVHRAGVVTEISQIDNHDGFAQIVAIGPAERFCADEIERRWQSVLVKD